MDEGEALTASKFKGELDLLAQFGMRNFYYDVSLPNPILSDDLFVNLIDILVSLAAHQIDNKKAVENIQAIKARSNSFPDFQNSLSQISEKITSDSNSQKYVWELASNFALLCHEYLGYLKSTLSILGLQKNGDLENHFQSTQTQIQILSTCKPKDARDSKPISFNLANPEIGSSFNTFAQAKTTILPKCTICDEPATWYAFPCSHPVYCDLEYDDSLADDSLYTNCPLCDRPIEKYINIPLPQ